MAAFDPYGDRTHSILFGLVLVAVVVGVATASAFFVDPADEAPDPVLYDDTVELGLSAETDELMAESATVPRAQVFYSQLQYVVGYNGIESFVDRLNDGRTESQFGYPLVAYVETFDDRDPGTTDAGLFAASSPTGPPAWTPADEAMYVIDSDVRTPAGKTVVPFETEHAAESFAEAHDGTVADWETVRSTSFDVDSAATVRSMVPERHDTADERLAAAERRNDRPVSIVVGDDEPTIEAAVDAAPPNTTVVVPPGTYDETVTVAESITLAGEEAHIRGEENGSVITVRAPDVVLTGLTIDGTGNQTRDPDAAREAAIDDGDVNSNNETPDDEAWDTNIQLGYGHGDAGIRAIDAPGLFIDGVGIETSASGVLLRNGSNAVIQNVTVDGTDEWRDGFMGIIGIESRVTVTDSAFTGGRDGVYLHRADESIVRDSSFAENRYGAHLMYTGDALIADNVISDGVYGGITVMTRPARNAIVGNDIRESSAGVQASGTRTYIGHNTLVDNDLGLSTSSRGSLYEHNVLVNNEQGARATTVVPSSRVVANDFVGNDDHAAAGSGALRVWADRDRGNYWEGADVGFHDPGERAYHPTSPVDGALHREPAAVAVRESPAVALLDRLRGTVPGARSGSIIDPVPASEPHAPGRVAEATRTEESDPHNSSGATNTSVSPTLTPINRSVGAVTADRTPVATADRTLERKP